jgi:hypothetical protein
MFCCCSYSFLLIIISHNKPNNTTPKFLTGHGRVSEMNDALYGSRFEFRKSFSKTLTSYDEGTMVCKQDEPWGHNNELYNQEFLIKEKYLRSNTGEIHFIKVQDLSNKREYILRDEYFNSWTSVNDLKKAYDDMTSP